MTVHTPEIKPAHIRAASRRLAVRDTLSMAERDNRFILAWLLRRYLKTLL